MTPRSRTVGVWTLERTARINGALDEYADAVRKFDHARHFEEPDDIGLAQEWLVKKRDAVIVLACNSHDALVAQRNRLLEAVNRVISHFAIRGTHDQAEAETLSECHSALAALDGADA